MSQNPLSHLHRLGPESVVVSAASVRNPGEEGGVLVVFAMEKTRTQPILFISGVIEQLADALTTFARTAKREAENPRLALTYSLKKPAIGDADWKAVATDDHVVETVKALVATNALALELVMQDGTLRHLALPVGITRLLADELRKLY